MPTSLENVQATKKGTPQCSKEKVHQTATRTSSQPEFSQKGTTAHCAGTIQHVIDVLTAQ